MPSSRTLRGFTLIELLVVIAIIAILSAVVFSSLYLGRYKAADAAIKSDLHTIQSQMEIYFSNNNNSYGTTVSQSSPQTTGPGSIGTNAFVVDSTINGAMKAAVAQGGSGYWSVGTGGNTYGAAVKLKADSGYWWCVDASGQPKREADAVMSGNALDRGGGSVGCP